VTACDGCLRRTALIARLSAHLDRARERWGSATSLLALEDAALVAALAGSRAGDVAAWLEAFDPAEAREACAAAGLGAVCRHDRALYPEPLRVTPDPPAVLHVAGGVDRLRALLAAPAVALVGARRATPHGLEAARTLARGLAVADVTVVSGMALGVDAAAHTGALDAGGGSVAVLAGGADVAYPAAERRLHTRLVAAGCVVSELPPGTRPRKWGFPARNRIIAGLARVTVVVEAAERSGSLITARVARDLGRDVAAVPGRITSPRARGALDLLFDGAQLIRDVRDLLELLHGVGAAGPPPRAPVSEACVGLDPRLRAVLEAVADGRDTIDALAADSAQAAAAGVALGELELMGRLRRVPGGRYVLVS